MKIPQREVFKVKRESPIRKFGLRIGLLILILLLGEGCHKDSIAPVLIDIKLGYMDQKPDGSGQGTMFKNQNQISSGGPEAYALVNGPMQGLYLNLSEQHVNCNTINFFSGANLFDSLQYIFNFSTMKDKEIFVPGKNGMVVAEGTGSNSRTDCSIDLTYRFIVKFTNKAVPNNDTLEINLIDTVFFNYHSLYTTKTFSSKLVVTQ